jgi:hypothetical protein
MPGATRVPKSFNPNRAGNVDAFNEPVFVERAYATALRVRGSALHATCQFPCAEAHQAALALKL